MLNHITVMGRLVADPELRNTDSGTPVCSFRIACDRDYKPKDGERETDFINVTAWRTIFSAFSARTVSGCPTASI